MKKLFILTALFFTLTLQSLSASVKQYVIPKNVYIGDKAELKYVFQTEVDFFSDKIGEERTSHLDLSTDFYVFEQLKDSCSVLGACLDRTGFEYTLTISIIPWTVGTIFFAPFDLSALIKQSLNRDYTGAPFLIKLDPVTINSIVEKTQVKSLKPALSPFILPGTIFFISFVVILLILSMACLSIVLVKVPYFLFLYNVSKSTIAQRKLLRRTIKQLRRLLNVSGKIKDDREFCCRLQYILRMFLTHRFDRPFLSITTDLMYQEFTDVAGGSIDDDADHTVHQILEIFNRTDYVRYASGSIDSFKIPVALHQANLAEGERDMLISRSIKLVTQFVVEKKTVKEVM